MSERHGALDAIPKLADVSRPIVGEQVPRGAGGDAVDRASHFLGKLVDEQLRQNQHVAATRTQRRQADGALSWDEIRDKLADRRDLLDAVVFSGGEPTAQTALRDAVREVRALGFKVGLHTAGPYPSRLERLLPHTDWVGLDVKAPFDGYDSMTAVRGSALRALDSVCAVVESGVAYEVRTTVHPDLIGADELLRLARSLARLGVKRYAVQAFRGRGCADPHLLRSPRSAGLTPKRQAQLAELFEVFELRSA